MPYVLRVSPFASRKHACIFENLSEQFPGNSLNLSCKLLRKLNTIQQHLDKAAVLKLKCSSDIEEVKLIKTGCPFFFGYDATGSAKPMNIVAEKLPWEQPLSVNDHYKLGVINNSCPYYLMKSRVAQCDLAIIPYNYLIDKQLRD